MNIKSLLSFVTKLSPRERIIFYATVGVVSLVLLDRFILSPILNKISFLDQSIQISRHQTGAEGAEIPDIF